jgi:hypothetical protein
MTAKKEKPARGARPTVAEVKTAIESTGTALELRVAKAFMNAGFHVTQQVFFKSTDDGEHYETDLVALARRDLGPEMTLVIQFVIECKYLPTGFWLIHAKKGEASDPLAAMRQSATSALYLFMGAVSQTPLVTSMAILSLDPKPGYRLSQIPENPDYGYKALLQATRGAAGTIRQTDDLNKGLAQFPSAGAPVLQVLACPVVVVDGPLFRCALNERLELDVEEIQTGQVLWGKPSGDKSIFQVRVAEASIVERFARAMKICADQFLDSMAPHKAVLLRGHRKLVPGL